MHHNDDDDDTSARRPPWEPALNPLPPLVWALALPIIVMEAVFALATAGLIGGAQGVGWRLQTLQSLVFSPEHFSWMWQTGRFWTQDAARIFLYPFVHYNLTHAVFVVVFILTLGKFVADALRPWAILVVFLGSSAGAAVIYALLGQTIPLGGGYPGVFGLVGAFTFLLWLDLKTKGANPARAFVVIGSLLLVRLIFGLLFGSGPDWMADLAGFAVGFALTLGLSPDLRRRMLEQIRTRP